MATDTTTTTEVGSYFISNYPPFSLWKSDNVPQALDAFDKEPDDRPLGLYIHIPFCRKPVSYTHLTLPTKA